MRVFILKISLCFVVFLLLTSTKVLAQDEDEDENDENPYLEMENYRSSYEEIELYNDDSDRKRLGRRGNNEELYNSYNGGGIGSLPNDYTKKRNSDQVNNRQVLSPIDPPVDPDDVPINGAMGYLMVIGFGYGIYKLKSNQKKNNVKLTC